MEEQFAQYQTDLGVCKAVGTRQQDSYSLLPIMAEDLPLSQAVSRTQTERLKNIFLVRGKSSVGS